MWLQVKNDNGDDKTIVIKKLEFYQILLASSRKLIVKFAWLKI